VCAYIRDGGDRAEFLAQFGRAASPDFDPDEHLARIGLANQTTMLMSESLEIGEMFRAAMVARFGEEALADRFRAFETICSATQDRQDAVRALLDSQRLDLALVIGGYNSSNTCNLARMCADRVATFHIAGVEALASPDLIRHRPVGGTTETVGRDWLPSGPTVIGVTAGASTPDNIVGQVIERLAALAEAGEA
jgi:4-hydroxy-3-methylbut-2-enyl diphosphate reductase